MNNLLKNIPNLILASGSPRRKALLRQIDLDFEVIPSQIKENFEKDLEPIEFAKHYAHLKANDIAQKYSDSLVIGADTIVVIENEILGKPKDIAESEKMLELLSGKTHSVITGVSLIWDENAIVDTFYEKTAVTFQKLTKPQIHYYLRNYLPFDKAGSYAIQEWFAVCVKKIDGCYYNVMGLPLSKFYQHYSKIANDEFVVKDDPDVK